MFAALGVKILLESIYETIAVQHAPQIVLLDVLNIPSRLLLQEFVTLTVGQLNSNTFIHLSDMFSGAFLYITVAFRDVELLDLAHLL